MKLLFAECCRTLVVPHPDANCPAYCRCGLGACWWTDPTNGDFAVWHFHGQAMVSIIGIHSDLLRTPLPPGGLIGPGKMFAILEDTAPNFLFHQLDSLVVRYRPDFTSDAHFVRELP